MKCLHSQCVSIVHHSCKSLSQITLHGGQFTYPQFHILVTRIASNDFCLQGKEVKKYYDYFTVNIFLTRQVPWWRRSTNVGDGVHVLVCCGVQEYVSSYDRYKKYEPKQFSGIFHYLFVWDESSLSTGQQIAAGLCKRQHNTSLLYLAQCSSMLL